MLTCKIMCKIYGFVFAKYDLDLSTYLSTYLSFVFAKYDLVDIFYDYYSAAHTRVGEL